MSVNPSHASLASPASPALLACQDVSIGHAGRQGDARVLIRGLNLDLRPGQVMALLGRNGSGKSTLLRTWAGLQRPLSGKVTIMGRDLARLSPRDSALSIAWVTPFRDFAPDLTGWELAALGRQPHTAWHGRLGGEDDRIIEEALARCGALTLASRTLGTLSDGERQRLLLARAVAQETPILLLDEPTAFLDRPGRSMVFKLARDLARGQNRALIISTHDLDLAQRHADAILLLHQGHGHGGICGDTALNALIAEAFEEP